MYWETNKAKTGKTRKKLNKHHKTRFKKIIVCRNKK